MDQKTCTKCGELKSLKGFAKRKLSCDGHDSWCLSCCAAKNRRNYRQNAARHIERARDWARNNAERVKELQQEYHRKTYVKIGDDEWQLRKAATKERTAALHRDYLRQRYHSDPNYRERKRINKAAHDVRRRAARLVAELEADIQRIKTEGIGRQKAHYKICPILRLDPIVYAAAKKALKQTLEARRDPRKKRAATKAWKRKNPAQVSIQRYRRRTNLQNAKVDLTAAQWSAIKAAYRHRCAYCGLKKPLTQDHINPVILGGDHTASNIIPACRSCNSSKGGRLPTVTYQPHLIA